MFIKKIMNHIKIYNKLVQYPREIRHTFFFNYKKPQK